MNVMHTVRTVCRVMNAHLRGAYAWKHMSEFTRTLENRRLLGQIKQGWIQSGTV